MAMLFVSTFSPSTLALFLNLGVIALICGWSIIASFKHLRFTLTLRLPLLAQIVTSGFAFCVFAGATIVTYYIAWAILIFPTLKF